MFGRKLVSAIRLEIHSSSFERKILHRGKCNIVNKISITGYTGYYEISLFILVLMKKLIKNVI